MWWRRKGSWWRKVCRKFPRGCSVANAHASAFPMNANQRILAMWMQHLISTNLWGRFFFNWTFLKNEGVMWACICSLKTYCLNADFNSSQREWNHREKAVKQNSLNRKYGDATTILSSLVLSDRLKDGLLPGRTRDRQMCLCGIATSRR